MNQTEDLKLSPGTSSGLYTALCLQAIAECEDQTEEGKPSWRFDKTAATRYRLCIK